MCVLLPTHSRLEPVSSEFSNVVFYRNLITKPGVSTLPGLPFPIAVRGALWAGSWLPYASRFWEPLQRPLECKSFNTSEQLPQTIHTLCFPSHIRGRSSFSLRFWICIILLYEQGKERSLPTIRGAQNGGFSLLDCIVWKKELEGSFNLGLASHAWLLMVQLPRLLWLCPLVL